MNEGSLKLTTYFGERDRTDDRLVADELLDVYARHEVRCSVLLRGISGFGAKHQLHTDRLLTLSEDLPVVSVAVDARERIEALVPEVQAIKSHGLLTLERARLFSSAPMEPPEERGSATKATVYIGRQERIRGTAGFVALCELMYRRGLSGATVLLGVDGTVHGARARARFFSRNAEVPMMVISVGPRELIARVLPELMGMFDRPLLTLERVRVCKRDGELIARPHRPPATGEDGAAIWQKLMIHTSEASTRDGHPLHRVLARRLRAARVAGATSLRGIWGFHGEHAPHGDKLLQVRRHVPVVTVVIDTPDRIAQAFEIVDDVTSDRGLVTSELIPALM